MGVDELVPMVGNLKVFIEQFPVFASSPGGVEKLRDLILELAVEGKLVENDIAGGVLENLKCSASKIEKTLLYKRGKS